MHSIIESRQYLMQLIIIRARSVLTIIHAHWSCTSLLISSFDLPETKTRLYLEFIRFGSLLIEILYISTNSLRDKLKQHNHLSHYSGYTYDFSPENISWNTFEYEAHFSLLQRIPL